MTLAPRDLRDLPEPQARLVQPDLKDPLGRMDLTVHLDLRVFRVFRELWVLWVLLEETRDRLVPKVLQEWLPIPQVGFERCTGR